MDRNAVLLGTRAPAVIDISKHLGDALAKSDSPAAELWRLAQPDWMILKLQGKQVCVHPGDMVRAELPARKFAAGDRVKTNDVVMARVGSQLLVGAPTVEGASATLVVVGPAKSAKIRAFNYKAKKNERKKWGHRAQQAILRVEQLDIPTKEIETLEADSKRDLNLDRQKADRLLAPGPTDASVVEYASLVQRTNELKGVDQKVLKDGGLEIKIDRKAFLGQFKKGFKNARVSLFCPGFAVDVVQTSDGSIPSVEKAVLKARGAKAIKPTRFFISVNEAATGAMLQYEEVAVEW